MRSTSQPTPPLAWQSLPRGGYIAEQLQQRLDDWSSRLFGFTLLKVDPLSAALSLEQSRLRQGVIMAQFPVDGMDLQADATAMPFAAGSLDACLLAHVLDYSAHPHAILRQTELALRDDGWLILTGFNPYSLAGLSCLLPGVQRRLPRWRQMLSPNRLEDWLKLLGFEVIERDYFGFSALGYMPRLAYWRQQLCPNYCPSLAAVYIFLARKRRFPLTPIRELQPVKHALSQPGMARQLK
ncbi:class I SAM-dependent methyltransferase [Zobellella maritima]|uniref:class I SAM-dependent methyltransferase n=1 Tax=Zobellella maritima TaxID=2059725 RepID=UPI000E30817F|nr:methyltransferase domain-containing protein [Zobellella maritima]